MNTPPISNVEFYSWSEALEQVLSRHFSHRSPERYKALHAIVRCIQEALQGCDDRLETYAQINHGFWYKVYIFTPFGALRLDTGDERQVPPMEAREVVRMDALRRVPLRAVMANWETTKLWEDKRPLGALLLHTWQASHPYR
jgi:hypothetical protein